MSDMQKNYRLPAEWEPQEAIWLSWPTNPALWSGQFEAVRQRFVELTRTLARYQKVRINISEAAMAETARLLAGIENVELVENETNDVWCRDHGAIFLTGGQPEALLATDWIFNAWGGKFSPWDKDDAAPVGMARACGAPCVQVDTVLEGGAIDSNGAGQLLTSEAVLLNPNRYAEPNAARMEAVLKKNLGVRDILWLGEGLHNDDTDGHIDNLARFITPDAIVYAQAPNARHPDYSVLAENRERLEGFRTASGGHFDLIALPLSEPVVFHGHLLPASYANFVIINDAVIMPVFEQEKADKRAQGILRECFPQREIVPFPCREFLLEGGAVHCLSMNQPKVNRP